MRDLFARHFKDEGIPVAFEGDVAEVRKRMTGYFATPITDWSEGLIADLHRVAELGTGEGMQLILNEAIPDARTADALIRDTIGGADWEPHLGRSTSPFVNAATWSLMFTGGVIGDTGHSPEALRTAAGDIPDRGRDRRPAGRS